ncbi:MarR family winged helix-turn-helix transcriptional regulator [Hymenobacter sp. 15J16-1T3B]|uniref:MarR family winged helix-turn-helix transcriptional regulator n=1 Tax=Hymenobacter sp. 15J16-1T3B TaxID=2886941 RepID=UPI001D10872A|nr:MarR family winged helix-turn-helix transcriptional regulator [Hymenobacter sp. 15J16-1T3B]MCC3160429.1 MarR family winged helix-turn-helix transcriptional regulator [Hymenobacter sp. 15J16-1T3B]
MDYSLIKQLVLLSEEFHRDSPQSVDSATELAEFSRWLQARTGSADAPRRQTVEREPSHPMETAASVIGKFVTFMYRYLRTYSRLALLNTPLITYDDFTYLATVYGRGPLSKSELITRNIHEKPTGSEIIRRLLAAGLVQEAPHATDRRRKLLSLTPEGQRVLFEVFASMSQVAAMAAGNLSAAEQEQLAYLLTKLDAFHFPVFAAARPASLEEMRQQHFPHVSPEWRPTGAGGPPAGAGPEQPPQA